MLSSVLAALLLGRICIAGASCTETKSATITVAPAAQERRFFWIDADAKTAYAGVIAPKADAVVLDPKAYAAVDLTLEGDATRGWPLDVEMTMTPAPDQEWTWKLTPDEAKRLRRLYVPRGVYMLTAEAEHHHVLRARVVAQENPVKLTMRLEPLPLARGVVVDADDRAIAGATISFLDLTPCTTADDQGAFSCELPRQVPDSVLVSRDGYAPREVRIPRPPQTTMDLGRIRLSPGRALTVKVVRPEAVPARVSLIQNTGARRERTKMKTFALSEKEETVRFEVAEGDYALLVEGEGPLERLEVPIRDADVEKEIVVEPFELTGSVKFGDASIMDGEIELSPRRQSWRVSLPVTAGLFRATMWQKGVIHGWVKSEELPQSEPQISPELGDQPSRWDIRITKRMIVGRVFDAATKSPVPKAEMAVDGEFENASTSMAVTIDANGFYRVLASEPGTYTLQADSPEHLITAVELKITADDRTRTQDIALERGIVQPIDVIAPGGAPVPNASVMDCGPLRVSINPAVLIDERGHGELRGMPGSSRVLYVVPQEGGSFAVARVQFPRTSAEVRPLQVVIPPACCSLRIRSLTRDGQPYRGRVLVRYDGDVIPRTAIVNEQGEAVLRNLPAGTYEIWVVAFGEEELPSRKPAKVGLSSGEAVVTVEAER